MRINEYTTLEDFTSQYTGVWAPSDGHWFGLDFRYGGDNYRLHTGTMAADDPTHTIDGQEYLFTLYHQHTQGCSVTYQRLASFVSMDELLRYTGITDRPFSSVIMDDSTEILGQD